MQRRFEWFSFNEVPISDFVIEFLRERSGQFVTLSFHGCKLIYDRSDPRFPDRILECNNLKTLHVESSDVIYLFATIPNVIKLKLLYLNLTDYIISRLKESLSKLEALSLSGCVVCEDQEYKSYYVNEAAIETNPSQVVFTFESVKRLLEKNRNSLRSIDLHNVILSSSTVVAISEISGLKLRSVVFPKTFKAKYLRKFCENQCSLTSLNLSFQNRTNQQAWYNEAINGVCECLPNLQELVMRSNEQIDKGIIEVFQLQHLVKLDLTKCLNITKPSYRLAVSNLRAFQLEYLDLKSAAVGDEDLFKLLIRNRNIRYLDVSHTCISNKTLNMISKNLILLKYLVLEGCTSISDSGLTGEDPQAPTPLSNLRDLRHLDLRSILSITTAGCLEAIRFQKLECLFTEGCLNVVADEYFEAQLKGQNPCVELNPPLKQNFEAYISPTFDLS
ncbi:f-box domain-containing protein [Trichonephila clavipes]|nr:f-box domain-containing protein [Trichonephila clavipes]